MGRKGVVRRVRRRVRSSVCGGVLCGWVVAVWRRAVVRGLIDSRYHELAI